MNEFEQQVLSDLATLKSEMKALVGNGQPGRLRMIEEKVDRHESVINRAAGMVGLIGALLTAAHLAVDYLRLRH